MKRDLCKNCSCWRRHRESDWGDCWSTDSLDKHGVEELQAGTPRRTTRANDSCEAFIDFFDFSDEKAATERREVKR